MDKHEYSLPLFYFRCFSKGSVIRGLPSDGGKDSFSPPQQQICIKNPRETCGKQDSQTNTYSGLESILQITLAQPQYDLLFSCNF